MKRLAPQHRNRPLFVGLFAVWAVACREDVPLGAWDLPPEPSGQGGSATTTSASTVSGTGGMAGAGNDGTGGIPELPECLAAGNPGPLNPAGTAIGATETATDWTWPSPVTSVQFDLMVEREIERTMPVTGYYWAYQFSFLEGAAGFLGIQAEGVYQQDPVNDPDTIEITKMAVFWLSGPPLEAELGDIAYPDARVAPITASGVNYLTIHAKFDWQACRVYRFKIAQQSTEDDGSVWYGAWIEDTEDQVDTFLGRMRLPADSGAFAPFSISRTYPIAFADQANCAIHAPGSALYGYPHTVEGDVVASLETNRFGATLRCPTSRFTRFEGAVRHEHGVRP